MINYSNPGTLTVAQSAGESVSTVTTEKAKASFEAESKFTSPEGSNDDSVELFRHQTVDGEPFDGCYDSVRQRILSFKIETPDQACLFFFQVAFIFTIAISVTTQRILKKNGLFLPCF